MDTKEFPFESQFFEHPDGRLHYVDEGRGTPLVFIHGIPTWSFLWRHLILALRTERRVIAVDHLGFGLSDKPVDADYHPRRQSERLSSLLEHLGVRGATLAVHDFGGPIGLGHALNHPETVAELVLFNTWMWSLAEHPAAQQVDRIVRGWMGDVLYGWLNASPRWILPRVLGPGHRLDTRPYVEVVARRAERSGHLATARALLGASSWYDGLWQRREVLAQLPALLVWGTSDPTFGAEELQRWKKTLPHAVVCELTGVGHLPQEEAPERVLAALSPFLRRERATAA